MNAPRMDAEEPRNTGLAKTGRNKKLEEKIRR